MTPSAKAAEYKRTHRKYVFSWRSYGQEEVVGAATAAARLGVSEATLAVYLSNGRAEKGWPLENPDGAIDHLTVEAMPPPRAPRQQAEAIPKRPRGRPPKDLGPANKENEQPVDWASVKKRHKPN
jgi:hypothetical protein